MDRRLSLHPPRSLSRPGEVVQIHQLERVRLLPPVLLRYRKGPKDLVQDLADVGDVDDLDALLDRVGDVGFDVGPDAEGDDELCKGVEERKGSVRYEGEEGDKRRASETNS